MSIAARTMRLYEKIEKTNEAQWVGVASTDKSGQKLGDVLDARVANRSRVSEQDFLKKEDETYKFPGFNLCR